ncbi:GntR family transcriptional regulator [Bacillus aerolatus]|uniref:GntR family transcriptional regulator n=1 Tax=Bacillus aerolatus TaxID=2653354 RepID=A0A6I1FJA4_9BACI|nr:GntR family transcriptional regulator [Bacillus aerolatus]KAB7705916.1 GntR family transcriptional regulator [Bacillus aerolatus]
MQHERPQSKFAEVVEKIRDMIAADELLPGDKLPSERELSERLSAARSSVREALRALELLGLIETKRGEGTFLRDFSDHQLVQLLSTFILNKDQTKKDVQLTKEIVEMGCLSSVAAQPGLDEQLAELSAKMKKSSFTEHDFFAYLMDVSGNSLLKKIWLIVSDYAAAIHQENRPATDMEAFDHLIYSLKTKNIKDIFEAYKQLSSR